MDHLHPHRYPKHLTEKGQVFLGECNRTTCTNTGATWWNKATFGLYCKGCADMIDWNPSRTIICIEVNHKPSEDEMNELYKA